jgi:hypothetical protein
MIAMTPEQIATCDRIEEDLRIEAALFEEHRAAHREYDDATREASQRLEREQAEAYRRYQDSVAPHREVLRAKIDDINARTKAHKQAREGAR